jgi:hypothetical protein
VYFCSTRRAATKTCVLPRAFSGQRSAVSSLLTEALLGHHPKFTHLIFAETERRSLICVFTSPDVMRFLGHNIPAHGQVHGNFAGQVRSDLRAREEGIRIKHRLNGNSVKAYGKALRAEKEGCVKTFV